MKIHISYPSYKVPREPPQPILHPFTTPISRIGGGGRILFRLRVEIRASFPSGQPTHITYDKVLGLKYPRMSRPGFLVSTLCWEWRRVLQPGIGV